MGLSAKDISLILGLSKPIVYELFHRSDFPAIKISDKRWIVPRDQLKVWLENESTKNGKCF